MTSLLVDVDVAIVDPNSHASPAIILNADELSRSDKKRLRDNHALIQRIETRRAKTLPECKRLSITSEVFNGYHKIRCQCGTLYNKIACPNDRTRHFISPEQLDPNLKVGSDLTKFRLPIEDNTSYIIKQIVTEEDDDDKVEIINEKQNINKTEEVKLEGEFRWKFCKDCKMKKPIRCGGPHRHALKCDECVKKYKTLRNEYQITEDEDRVYACRECNEDYMIDEFSQQLCFICVKCWKQYEEDHPDIQFQKFQKWSQMHTQYLNVYNKRLAAVKANKSTKYDIAICGAYKWDAAESFEIPKGSIPPKLCETHRKQIQERTQAYLISYML
jgi:hypothetical protein